MNVSLLLEMAADGACDRVALGSRDAGMTYTQLLDRAQRTAKWLAGSDATNIGVLDGNSEAIPLLLFGAAVLGRPFAPLNYRLAPTQLRAIIDRLNPVTIVMGDSMTIPAGLPFAVETVGRSRFLAAIAGSSSPEVPWRPDPDDVAVLLFTSGTTGEPKAAVLRHRHLVSYVIGTVEFLGAGEDEAALISVPPYHVAGISAVLSSVYSGRRMVQMEAFDEERWVDLVRREAVTHAMVVPTMLGRILDVLECKGLALPSLRHLSYGGGRMPAATIERALSALPDVDFVNAYGLTETSSTIALLGPEDHRHAFGSEVPSVRRRLGSVGRPLPTLEVEIRDAGGVALPAGESGEINVRGDQVSGEYVGRHGLGVDGWFATKDGGFLDEEGFLFVEGRLDDVIVRGGENVSPGEIEDILLSHPAVADVCVVGLPDSEWGEQVAAAVVLAKGSQLAPDEIREWVRSHLRSSRVPGHIAIVVELPYSETGKLLRRVLRQQLAEGVPLVTDGSD
jgi:acyl-CoA synthetase (AMP-forming)/AMP-acid ligase II